MANPIVCIHGALGNGAQLAPLASRLRESHEGALDVRTLELPGHGDTEISDEGFAIEEFAAGVRAFMLARNLSGATLFGYSLGGYVALYLASEWPDVVSGVVTLGTKLAWTPDIAARETSKLDPATIRAKVPKFAELLESRHRGAGGWERLLERTATLMANLGTSPSVDAARIARIHSRVRLMVGDRDNVVTVDETASAARAMPAGDFVVLPSTPHPFEQVRMPPVAAMIRDFII